MVGVPANSGTVIVSADAEGDEVFLDSSGFDKPSRVLFGIAGQPLREIKSAPAFFEVDGCRACRPGIARWRAS